MEWNSGNVQKWVLWTEHLYRLPQVGRAFQDLSGKDLCAMSEDDFRQRCLQCGDVLYAHLDIWKSGTSETVSGTKPTEDRGSGSGGDSCDSPLNSQVQDVSINKYSVNHQG